jgi:hypothetical protein
MSESRSSATTADSDPELEEIANQLYALRPDDFAAARDEQVRKARAEGKQPLARELAKLRRPTQSAWLINMLWRDQHEVMQQLFQLADELSRAQAQASGRELQSLTAQRREIEGALLRRARALAEKAGVTVSAPMEREAQETLSAALALPEVADEVRTGRLVKPAAYAGFGTLPDAGARTRAPAAEPARPGKAEEPLDLRAAQRTREQREAAERQVQEARAAVDAAAETRADWERAASTAQEQHQDLRSQMEQLEKQLRDLRVAVATAEDAAQAAARRRDQADQAHHAALQALQRAEAARP